MDYFPHGLVVRLWSPAREEYLHADADGVGVSLRQHRASLNSEWEVRRVRRNGAEFFFLRSAATGRYLALSSSPPGHLAVQRDDGEPDHSAFFWRAFKEGDGVVLRNAFRNSKLRTSGSHRNEDNVVTAGNKDGSATAHWLVEAALPSLSPATPATPEAPPKLASLRVPRLDRENFNAAKLPLIGDRNVLAGYVAARSVLGLVEVMQGTGDFLRAQECVLRLEFGGGDGGQLPHELTALAFVGRGSGIRVLPLLVLADDANGIGVGDGDEAGESNDGAEAGVAGGNHDGVGHHGYNAEADKRGAGAEEQTVEGHDEVFQGAVAVFDVLPLNAAEVEAGAAAQGVANADAHQGEAGLPVPVQAAAAAALGNPAVLGLEKLYGGALGKRQIVQQLVQQLNNIEEHARAEGTRADRKQTNAVISGILKQVEGFKNIKDQVVKLLPEMEGDDAPAPPPVMEEDPEEWVPASVRRRLRRGS